MLSHAILSHFQVAKDEQEVEQVFCLLFLKITVQTTTKQGKEMVVSTFIQDEKKTKVLIGVIANNLHHHITSHTRTAQCVYYRITLLFPSLFI